MSKSVCRSAVLACALVFTAFAALVLPVYSASGWAVQDVDGVAVLSGGLSLALDSDGQPYIVYEVGSAIKFATTNATGWTIDTILTDFDTTLFPLGNIVLDSAGYPHFSCGINDLVMYVSWNGSAWNNQTVYSGLFLAHGTFLALDKNDNPHITFINSSGYVGYASWTGTFWFAQSVTRASLGEPMPLVMDAEGNPHIAYLDILPTYSPIDAKIMYATSNRSLPTPTLSPSPTPTLTPTPTLIQPASPTQTATSSPSFSPTNTSPHSSSQAQPFLSDTEITVVIVAVVLVSAVSLMLFLTRRGKSK